MIENAALSKRFRCDEFGYCMEYPTADEARLFSRELDWDNRFEVLSQGFHRGCYFEQCYGIHDLAKYVGKRSERNPTGGVRDIDAEKLIFWVADSVGDVVLAKTIYKAFDSEDPFPVMLDTLRNVLTVRVNQYGEVLSEQQ